MRLSFSALRQGALAPPWAVCSSEVPPNKEGLGLAPELVSPSLVPPLHRRAGRGLTYWSPEQLSSSSLGGGVSGWGGRREQASSSAHTWKGAGSDRGK